MFGMNSARAGCLGAALVLLPSTFPATASGDSSPQSDWPMIRGDRFATQRVEGASAAITGQSGAFPVKKWDLERYGASFGWGKTASRRVPIDSPDDLHVLIYFINQGRLRAYDLHDDTVHQQTAALQIDGIAAIYDDFYWDNTIGAHVPLLIVAAGSGGGGLYALNGRTLARIWTGRDWNQSVGVSASEVVATPWVPGSTSGPFLMFNVSGGGLTDVFQANLDDIDDLQAEWPYISIPLHLSGSGWNTVGFAQDLNADDDLEYLLLNANMLDIYYPCPPGSGTCNLDGTACLCQQGLKIMTPTWSRTTFLADLEGDGGRALIDSTTSRAYEVALSRVDLSAPAGTAPSASVAWRYSYGDPAVTKTVIPVDVVLARGGPVDLDGDGSLEIVASFFNNTDTEVVTGITPLGDDGGDGVYLPDDWALAVFDAGGHKLAACDSLVGYGVVDFRDGGGPIVLARDVEDGETNGILYGLVLDPSAPCGLRSVWQLEGAEPLSWLPRPQRPNIGTTVAEEWFDWSESATSLALPILDQGEGPWLMVRVGSDIAALRPEYGAASGEHGDPVGGQWPGAERIDGDLDGADLILRWAPSELGYAEVTDIVGEGDDILITIDNEDSMLVLGPDLMPLGAAVSSNYILREIAPTIATVRLEPDVPASLVLDSVLYTPSVNHGAPQPLCSLPGTFAFAADLDNDGHKEIVARGSSSAGYPLDCLDVDLEQGTCTRRWTWDREGYTEFGLRPPTLLSYGDTDPDTEGLEVVFGAERSGDWSSPDMLFGALPVLPRPDETTPRPNTPLWFGYGSTDYRFQYGATWLIVGDLDGDPANGDEHALPYTSYCDLFRRDTLLARWSPSRQGGNMAGRFSGRDLSDILLIDSDGRAPAYVSTWVPFDDDGAPAGTMIWTQSVNALSGRNWSTGYAALDVNGDGADDLLVATAAGSLEVRDGTTGNMLSSAWPIYFKEDAIYTERPEGTRAALAVIAVNVDGDVGAGGEMGEERSTGSIDVLVTNEEGRLYALRVIGTDTPVLLWSYPAGTAIIGLATGDIDGDGALEVVLSWENGGVRVIDNGASRLKLVLPGGSACTCEQALPIEVHGVWIDSFDILLQGDVEYPVVHVEPDEPQEFVYATTITLPSWGTLHLEVVGSYEGESTTGDELDVTWNPDGDGDGWAACQGDCQPDDPAIHPGAEEMCDGIDNDCNGVADEGCEPVVVTPTPTPAAITPTLSVFTPTPTPTVDTPTQSVVTPTQTPTVDTPTQSVVTPTQTPAEVTPTQSVVTPTRPSAGDDDSSGDDDASSSDGEEVPGCSCAPPAGTSSRGGPVGAILYGLFAVRLFRRPRLPMSQSSSEREGPVAGLL